MATVTEVRLGKPSERGALSELHRRSSYVWEEDQAQLDAHPDALGVGHEAIVDGRVRVAVGQGGELLGFSVVADAQGEVCELKDLFVDPDVVRHGVGRTLVEDAAARAFSAGYREMTVVAHPRNFAFYGNVGFVPGEPVNTRFGPATRLRRRLGPAGESSRRCSSPRKAEAAESGCPAPPHRPTRQSRVRPSRRSLPCECGGQPG